MGKVHPIPDDNVDMGQEAAPAPTGMVLSRGMAAPGKRRGGGETEVDAVNHEVLRPFAPTMNAVLPYYKYGTATIESSDTTTGQQALSFRLNSIVDIWSNTTYSANPTAAAEAKDGAAGTWDSPMMYGYWRQLYQYYTVTRTEYKIRFWTGKKDDDYEMSIWCYHHGAQRPPLLDGTKPIKDQYRHLHRHAHVKHLNAKPTGSTETHNMFNSVTFNGAYEPGNRYVESEVYEDAYQETWHKIDAVPSLLENATFILNRSDRSPLGQCIWYYDCRIIYHVQFKDLKAIFQYPTSADDFPAITDYVSAVTE